MKFVEKNQNGFSAIGIVAVVAVLVVLAGGWYFAYQRFAKPVDTGRTACSAEAKLCPDGSSVGRTGPNCEFALCPGEIDTSNWKVYSNEVLGFQFRYPANWLVVDDWVEDGVVNISSISKEILDPATERYILNPAKDGISLDVLFGECISQDYKIPTDNSLFFGCAVNPTATFRIARNGPSSDAENQQLLNVMVSSFRTIPALGIPPLSIVGQVGQTSNPEVISYQHDKKLFYGDLSAWPSFLNKGIPTVISVETYIPDLNLISSGVLLTRVTEKGDIQSIIGQLNDGGLRGDLRRNDKRFGGSFIFTESDDNPIILQVSAKFKSVGEYGKEGRLLSRQSRIFKQEYILDRGPDNLLMELKKTCPNAKNFDALAIYFTTQEFLSLKESEKLGVSVQEFCKTIYTAEFSYQTYDSAYFSVKIKMLDGVFGGDIIIEKFPDGWKISTF